MVTKFFTILFFGSILTLIPLVVFFAGVQKNYLEYYGIAVYFNPYFAYAFDGLKFLGISISTGFLLFFAKMANAFRILYVGVVILTMFSFLPIIGHSWGKAIFYKESVEITLPNGKTTQAALIYEGRDALYYRRGEGMHVERVEKRRMR
ncbi:MAG: hypothetical protein ACTTH5_03200 [Wolinella sp.]